MSENNDGNVGIDKRKLTPAEKRRKENFDRIEQDMISKGKDVVLLDHPYECGLVAFEKPAE